MHQTKLSAILITTILATCLPVYAQEQSQSIDLIGVGTTLLNSIINPPHRTAEINAEVEIKKAKIAAEAEIEKERMRIEANKTADQVTPMLTQWGVSRVDCSPNVAFINGVSTDTICIQPNQAIKPGYYNYDREKGQLIRTSSSIQVTQSTTISSPNKTTINPGF